MDGSLKPYSIGRILVIDRDIHMLKMLEMILCGEYQVSTARSAEEGLDVMSSEEPFHIVMTSFNLPGMNGLDLIEQVHHRFPLTVRLLMATSFENEHGMNRAISEGQISRVIMKPFCVSTLLKHLKNDFDSLPKKNWNPEGDNPWPHTHW